MNLKEQLYVCTLAEYGHITRAAEKLFITQPALSIYINNLEEYLGIKLFDRIGKKFVLTYAGHKYVEKAKKMLSLKDEFEIELSQLIDQTIGKIRIGVQTRRAVYIIPKALSRFIKEYPKIEVIIKEGTHAPLHKAFEDNEIDIILYSLLDKKVNYEYKFLINDPLLIAIPEAHYANKKSVIVSDAKFKSLNLTFLKEEKFILPAEHQNLRILADKALMEGNVTPKNIMVIRNIETAMHMVSEGLGVGFNRGDYAARMSFDSPINYYKILNGEYNTNVVICWKKGVILPKYTKRFIDIVAEIYELMEQNTN